MYARMWRDHAAGFDMAGHFYLALFGALPYRLSTPLGDRLTVGPQTLTLVV
jgi:hypothetical protein